MDIAGILLLIYLGLMLFGNDDVRGVMLGLMVLSGILSFILLIFFDLFEFMS